MKFPFSLRTDALFDAVGFGTNAVDNLIRLGDYPKPESKCEIAELTVSPGGEIASSMVGLQRLGWKTAYAGRFGNDLAGQMGLDSLAREGVDLEFAETIEGAATQSGFIIIDASSGERTVLWHRDPKLSFTAADTPLKAATIGKLLHMTAHDTAACVRMAAAAREAGVIVSLDVDKVFEGIEDLLPLVDILTVAPLFADTLTAGSNKALEDLRYCYGSPFVVMTLGKRGSVALCGDKLIESPGFKVPGGCIDTTGAGDAFRAGLLHGVLSGLSVEDSLVTANAVAALKCRGHGARNSLPDLRELDHLLKNM
jgi:sugar/nucleoside kinase (ribokinase family)